MKMPNNPQAYHLSTPGSATNFFSAIKRGNKEIMIAYLQYRYRGQPDYDTPDNDDFLRRTLHEAITAGRSDSVAFLLSYQIAPNLSLPYDEAMKEWALSTAVITYQVEICRILLEHIQRISTKFYNDFLCFQLNNRLSENTGDELLRTQAQEIMLCVLAHPNIEDRQTKPVDTLQYIAIAQGLLTLLAYFFEQGLNLATLTRADKKQIISSLITSKYCGILMNQYPALIELVNEELNANLFHENSDLFIRAAKNNNIRIMEHIQTNPLFEIDYPSILTRIIDSERPKKETIEWLLSNALRKTNPDNVWYTILPMLAKKPGQVDLFEMAMTHPHPTLDTLLQQEAFPREIANEIVRGLRENVPFGAAMGTEALLRPFYALVNRMIDQGRLQNPNSLAARYNQTDALQASSIQAPPITRRHHPSISIPQCLFTNATESRRRYQYSTTPIDAKDDKGMTALHHVTLGAPFRIMALVLPLDSTNNADDLDEYDDYNAPDTTNDDTIESIMDAISDQHPIQQILATINKLLKFKALINMPDNSGDTPLHYAAASHAPEIISHLIKRGAYINQKNSAGVTPLMLACKFNNDSAIQALLDLNANIYDRDNENRGIPDYLENNKHGMTEIATIIQTRMAEQATPAF
jgi:ankyrin repeat protein